MNFDFDNFDKYLRPEVSVEAQTKIDLLDSHIKVNMISEKEHKFIDDVKRRIRADKSITDKQKIWLAKIIKRCREEPQPPTK